LAIFNIFSVKNAFKRMTFIRLV